MRRKRIYRHCPLTRKQQELAARYVPLARALSKPLRKIYPDRCDELDSAALLALVHAAVTYDPARGALFSTYARHRIWGALRDFLRKMTLPKLNRTSRSAPGLVSLSMTSEEQKLILNRSDDRPVGKNLETADEVEFWLSKLPAQHAAACREVDLQGKTHQQAAVALGCSRTRLSDMRREAFEILTTLAEYYDPARGVMAI